MAWRDANSNQGTHIDLTLVAVVMIYSNCSITLRSQIIWWLHCSRTGSSHHLERETTVMPCHVNNMHATQGKAGAKQGSNPPRKPLSLHSERSLCPGEHRGQGDGRHTWWDQGVFLLSILYIDSASIARSSCSYAESHRFWHERLPCDSRFAEASSVYLYP